MTTYIGRFAPSPTGHLHLGSLYVALASYLDAKSNHGTWILRIDDVDRDRCKPEFSTSIINTLHLFGMDSDQEIRYQSNQGAIYSSHIEALSEHGHIFYCSCSRAKLKLKTPPYPGFCRNNKTPIPNQASAIRLKAPKAMISFEDLWYNYQQANTEVIGDTIIFRRDGFASYHLATVIDDAEQGITHVIRGMDLLQATPTQIMIQRALNYKSPKYGHLPLVLGKDKKKLSKQNQAPSINAADPNLDPMKILNQCSPWLGLKNHKIKRLDNPERWLNIAINSWQRQNIQPNKGFLAN